MEVDIHLKFRFIKTKACFKYYFDFKNKDYFKKFSFDQDCLMDFIAE